MVTFSDLKIVIMTKTEQVKKHILDNPELDNQSVATAANTTKFFAQKCRHQLRKEGKLPPVEENFRRKKEEPEKEKEFKREDISEEINQRKENAIIKFLRDKNKILVNELEDLSVRYDDALLIKTHSDTEPFSIDINPRKTSQAVPIIQWSDWHVEERIEKATTHGKNEYNPSIAEKRVKKLVQNTIKLIRKEKQDVHIEELVLCLGGDFINNYLHEHDVQMNFLTPIEAVLFARKLLRQAIETLAEYAGVKKIRVVCIRGNHGRITKRMQSSNDYKMNYEAIIYNILAQDFDDRMFDWYIPESELGYIQVYNKVIRAYHGHQIFYQGGVGDLGIPTNKAIMKWDKTTKANWNLMHHYHSFWMPTRNCSLNGSLCGWNSYAASIGAPHEPASQTIHLLDSKRGFTVRTPIDCD